MSKKKIIILIVTCAVVFFAVVGSLYAYVLHLEDERIKSLFTEDALNYLNSDESFTSAYGVVTALTGEEKIPVETDEGVYMTFHCVTAEQELTVRVYGVYDDGWSYYYEIP